MKKLDLNKLSTEELFALEEEIKIKEGLPHLFGYKRYKWQRDFENSTNRDNLLCAANQTGKSTCQISKCITWATEPSLWPLLWHSKPKTFLYFYPSLKLATIEYEEKWLKEQLPREEFKDHPQYGWKATYRQKEIYCIEFNTGVTVYFFSYSQDYSDVQAMTIWAIFADEEMPEDLYPELQARIRATRGYFHMVFTATLGQEFWRRAIEGIGGATETFRNAFKRQISMYDCQYFEDGSKSQWTDARIKEEIQRCGTEREVSRRIFGKFVVDGGTKYPSFIRSVHMVEEFDVPKDWKKYAGVDVGSGGSKGHKGSMAFVAVNPECTKGVVYKCWRGDGFITTASDILNKFIEIRGNEQLVSQFYDFASKDFYVIAQRNGEPFIPADKSHERGEGLLNTLFKNNMLFIVNDDQGEKAANEFINLSQKVMKIHAQDDLIDAIRYTCCGIPWDFSCVRHKTEVVSKEDPTILMNTREKTIYDKKHGIISDDITDVTDFMSTEMEEANEFYEM